MPIWTSAKLHGMLNSATDDRFQISAEAQGDLFEIWQRIAMDSVKLADSIRR